MILWDHRVHRTGRATWHLPSVALLFLGGFSAKPRWRRYTYISLSLSLLSNWPPAFLIIRRLSEPFGRIAPLRELFTDLPARAWRTDPSLNVGQICTDTPRTLLRVNILCTLLITVYFLSFSYWHWMSRSIKSYVKLWSCSQSNPFACPLTRKFFSRNRERLYPTLRKKTSSD